jgi:histidinol dehydrogenase
MMAGMRWIESLEAALEAFRERSTETVDVELSARVRAIIDEVRAGGDEAVLALTERFDGVRPDGLAVPAHSLAAAESRIAPELAEAIRLAVRRVRAYYERQPSSGFLDQQPGGLLGQLVRPLTRVGCYVPGGTAPLFSSVLMTAVPAQVAGVRDIVLATPPRADGSVAPEILFAASILGIEEVYRMGGAQAVAALAFGTASVAPVDKVVGPGNRYVVAAKREVFGRVGVESLPGPTETLVLADDGADARHVVADLLAQAEHLGAQPVLVTPSRRLARAVEGALPAAIATLPTAAAARESVEERGLIVIVDDLHDGITVANAYAPEHLCLLVRDPWSLVPEVVNAGGVFVGEHSMEALGDYLAGPSHVMPTSGTARYASFVNVRDFQKVIPLVALGASAVAQIGPAAARMARAEGLEAHARAIESRLERD